MTETRGFEWAATTKTSPSDASGASFRRRGDGQYGPKCKYFFILRVFYVLTNLFRYYLCVMKPRGGFGWAAMTKTSPNDVSGVVSAKCKSFFILRVFYVLSVL